MPLNYARRLTGRERTTAANRHLGLALAGVAGATNAGGFLAVHQYTSHVTGTVSALADSFALGTVTVALTSLASILAFMLGAMTSAILVNFARQRGWRSEFATPLLLEAALLLLFGLAGAQLEHVAGLFVSVTVLLLCFLMGLQNAVITKISRAEIRTTHMTGIVTDIGIELGRLVYRNQASTPPERRVLADRQRLGLLCALLGAFFFGGVVGGFGFQYIGYAATVPLAGVLVFFAAVPIWDDLTDSKA